MRNSKFIICFVAILALALAAGCGGGGQGLRIPSSPLAITSSSIPAHLSGEYIDWEIPITGGCGGPYVVEVIAGNLPLGVGAVADTEHALRGYILDDGIFSFTVKITDTTCDPFFTATQAFVWDVQQGPVKIVAANPGIVLNADYDDPQKHDNEPGPDTILGTEDDITIDALETVVFNTFVSYQLIAAGGVGPYTCAVIDDPSDALDGALPLGTSMAPLSCSLVGSPAQVLAGGVPFRLTIRVTDSVGNTSVRKFQWKIDTPPIIIANSALVNGKCGTWFSDAVQLVDGVPPFRFELTDNAPGDDGNPDTTDNQNDDITYPPGFTPVVNTYVNGALPFQLTPTGPTALARLHQTTGRVLYPAQTDNGPNYSPMPSEGLYFREAGAGAGSFFGVPRRRGTFTIFVHAFSTLVPNERGQHAFKALSHTIDPSEPPTGLNPAFDMDPAFTLQGAFNPAAPHGTLAEAEVTVLYNPDSGSGHAANGLKLLGQGGVPQDGYIDAPHEANQLPTFAEVDGEYSWTYDPLTPLPGMTLFAGVPGTFGTATPADANELIRSGSRPIRFGITDEILPLSVRAATNTRTRDFNISVGPDLVIITESTQSFTGTSTTGTNQADMHDREIKVRGFEVLGGSGVVTDLKDGNMSTNHVVPAIAGLAGTDQVGKLLSGTTPGDATRDLLRISVNPGGWWDDQGNMNPKGARAHMGADKNAGQTYVQANGWYNSGGGWHAGVSGVDLPNTPSIAHDPASGIFADGGRMFAFNSGNRFGLFVIRGNASVYVPFAIQRGTLGIWQFGDGMTFAGSTDSNFLTVPLAVSPDGRFATVKVIKTTSNALTTMSSWNNAVLVLISLTGEKFASGDTYQIIDTNLASEGGSYMYSTSMVMNDQMLYFLSGNYATTYASWRDHYIHQYRYRSTGGVLVAPGGNAGAVAQLASGIGGNWTQATFTPMQTPFHKWDNPTSQSNTFLSSGGFGIVTIPNNDMYLYDGWNMGENSTAPVPFRSSADGKHMALLAGPRSASTSGTDVMSHFCWVSSNGGDFRQASTVARHSPGGASRGYGLARGPTAYYHWGRFSAPRRDWRSRTMALPLRSATTGWDR
ncbi:MAG: Ig domain-containing protein [Planctomycetota bacterium]|nr:Ig domain-containing protein [Planctomycetota bacterium]